MTKSKRQIKTLDEEKEEGVYLVKGNIGKDYHRRSTNRETWKGNKNKNNNNIENGCSYCLKHHEKGRCPTKE